MSKPPEGLNRRRGIASPTGKSPRQVVNMGFWLPGRIPATSKREVPDQNIRSQRCTTIATLREWSWDYFWRWRRPVPKTGATFLHRRPISAHTPVAGAIPLSGVVPRCEVRHLVPLGTAGRAHGRRRLRPRYLQRGKQALPAPAETLRSPVEVRLQGHYRPVEGGEVGSRPADGPVQEGRGRGIS